MSQTLTREYFDQIVQGLATKKDLKGFAKEDLAGFATKDDIHRLEASMATKDDLEELRGEIRTDFSQLQISVDTYFKRTEGWYQEFSILKGKHDKLSGALVQKRVVSEKDTLL